MCANLRSICSVGWAIACLAIGTDARAIVSGAPPPVETLPDLDRSTLLLRTAKGTCTATLIGPRVILTAAFCVDEQATATVATNGGALNLKCTAHPEFPKNPSATFALCRLDQDFPGKPERIGDGASLPTSGTTIYLAGLGCNRPGGFDASLGVLRVGEAIVTQAPVYSGSDVNIFTEGVSLCSGDAGGGAYLARPGNDRALVGVLTSGNSKAAHAIAVSTATNLFQQWARGWASGNGVEICGFDADAGCSEVDVNAFLPTAELDPGKVEAFLAPPRSDENELPTSLKIPSETRANESVEALVERVCRGPQPDEYFVQLERLHASMGTGIRRSTIFSEVKDVDIPACTTESTITVKIKKGDRPWDYWTVYSRNQASYWSDFQRPPGQPDKGLFSRYFLDVFNALNSGVDETNLKIGSTVTVHLFPVDEQRAVPLVAASDNSFDPILAGTDLSCKTKPNASYPYDLSMLLEVLARHRVYGHTPRSIGILVADSGLYGAGQHSIFGKNVLLLRSPRIDQAFLDSISPLKRGREGDHGTQVASVALGGPIFSRIQVLSEPRIKLGMSRIYQRYVREGHEWFGAREQDFNVVLRDANHGAEIVNLSAKYKDRILALEEAFKGDAKFLFVVAAGNKDGQLGKEFQNNIYPALYGGIGNGRSALNTITVTALEAGPAEDGKLHLAPFSNFSPDYVDIAAPGCEIPALTYDKGANNWKLVSLSGTSMATPLVSFTAALVKSEVPVAFSAAETKTRLMAASDLHSELAGEVVDGRTLNITKAVALYEDVVELTDKQLLFGEVKFEKNGTELSDSFTLDCEGVATPFNISDVLKIWPRFKTENDREIARIYVKADASEAFRSKSCVLPSDPSGDDYLRVILRWDDHARVFTFQEIRDIVRKSL